MPGWIAGIALVFLVGFPLANARASVLFYWSYSDGGLDVGGGTLTTTYLDSDRYQVTAISGIANGHAIVGLTTYAAARNIVYATSAPNLALDTSGLAFSIGNESFNLYADNGLFLPTDAYYCGSAYCLVGPGTVGRGDPVVAVSFSLIPEPITLVAYGTGIFGLAAVRRRRPAPSGGAA